MTEVLKLAVGPRLTENLTPALLIQLFFVIAAAGVLAIAAAPASAQRLLTEYGARNSTTPQAAPAAASQQQQQDPFTNLVRRVTSVGKIPHSWFLHFYVLSLASSLFWAAQYLSHGRILVALASTQAGKTSASMTANQVVLAWCLMALQGARRLHESLAVIRPSASTMWIVHWLLGCTFYLLIGVAVWVEGSRSILLPEEQSHAGLFPSWNECLGIPMFLLAWSTQYRCHKYLSSLKKYSLPKAGLFRYIICPHYTCECLLYLALAIVAAPEHQWCNKTLTCGVLFVSVNLGVTARGTRDWYAEKFGAGSVQGKWKMIPLLY